MKRANIYCLVALAFVSSQTLASTITDCNATTNVCVTRSMTTQEQSEFDATNAKIASDAITSKPFQYVTRRQIAQAFRDCSGAGSAALVLACIRDNLTNLETQ